MKETEITYEPFPRESSNLLRHNYNPKTKELRLQLNSSYYLYKDVPKSVYEGLLEAESHGKYFYAHIREKYPTSRIEYTEG